MNASGYGYTHHSCCAHLPYVPTRGRGTKAGGQRRLDRHRHTYDAQSTSPLTSNIRQTLTAWLGSCRPLTWGIGMGASCACVEEGGGSWGRYVRQWRSAPARCVYAARAVQGQAKLHKPLCLAGCPGTIAAGCGTKKHGHAATAAAATATAHARGPSEPPPPPPPSAPAQVLQGGLKLQLSRRRPSAALRRPPPRHGLWPSPVLGR